MSHWLFPANTKFYDVLAAFSQSQTYWPKSATVLPGDTVYIYLAAPYKQIGFVCEVLEIGLQSAAVLEEVRPFFKGEPPADKQGKEFIKLKPIQTIELQKDSLLGLSYLKAHGLNGMLMGARKLENNPPLFEYILGIAK